MCQDVILIISYNQKMWPNCASLETNTAKLNVPPQIMQPLLHILIPRSTKSNSLREFFIKQSEDDDFPGCCREI